MKLLPRQCSSIRMHKEYTRDKITSGDSRSKPQQPGERNCSETYRQSILLQFGVPILCTKLIERGNDTLHDRIMLSCLGTRKAVIYYALGIYERQNYLRWQSIKATTAWWTKLLWDVPSKYSPPFWSTLARNQSHFYHSIKRGNDALVIEWGSPCNGQS